MEIGSSSKVEVLQAKLDALLRIANHNDQKQQVFQQYELSLLNSTDLFDLLSIILEQHRKQFQLTEVTLLLLDPEYEYQRLLNAFPLPDSWSGRLLFTDSEAELKHAFHIPRKARLLPYDLHQHHGLFPNHAELRSIAILPLSRRNKVIGSLNLGSRQAERFQAGIGTQFLQHLAAVIAASIENARLQESIKQLGLRDPLTGVNNRRYFDQRIDEEVSLAKRNNTPLSCLFIDLDHFKRVNDEHGHQVGDAVLKQTAEILADTMRTSDVLARYGGEEFVILLANTGNQLAYDIAERIRIRVAETLFTATAEPLRLTLSIGLATLVNNGDIASTKQLVNAADQAVYVAKESGRNKVHHSN